MTEAQPYRLQELCYTADEFRQLADVCGEGVIDVYSGALLVASTGAADNSVTVAAGAAYVEGDDDAPEQGFYRVAEVGTSDPLQLTDGDATLPRVDTVVATVLDSQFGGTDDKWVPVIVDGTPNASAALTDAGIAASAATVPDDSIVLAYILVTAGDTSTHTVTAGDILDARNNYHRCGTQPYVALRASGTTSMATATYVQNTLAVLDHCDRDYFSVSGSTITIKQPGLYDINGHGGFTGIGSAGTVRAVEIFKNNTNLPNAAADGTSIVSGYGGAATTYRSSPTRDKYGLVANDTIKMAQIQDVGTTQSSYSGAFLTVTKVG